MGWTLRSCRVALSVFYTCIRLSELKFMYRKYFETMDVFNSYGNCPEIIQFGLRMQKCAKNMILERKQCTLTRLFFLQRQSDPCL